jgi:catecholate siderophore receptor
MLPVGAMLLAGSLSAMAQQPPATEGKTLQTVTVKDKAEAPEGKDAVRATRVSIGKGTQEVRDIPQSVTVVTERLIDDRNLDTLKEALKNTAGISFLAAEGGEEDIRLRGFPLQATGDVFVDGMRDPAFYERDTFNLDRMELLRGSASMLFGRGSTGGAVNMVNKAPRLMDEHQVDVTLGSHNYRRAVGDFNIHTGDNAALRISAMSTTADNNGAGSSIEKKGISGSYRWGIGERDEFSVSLYHLDNRNGMNYGMPWIRPTAASSAAETTLLPLDPTAYYGMASDVNAGTATYGTLTHLHRFDGGGELKTQLRKGAYTRDQRASTIRLCQGSTHATTGIYTANANCPTVTSANLGNFGASTILNHGTQLKIQDLDSTYAQSDYSGSFSALGMRHDILTGVDLALEKKVVYGARSAAQGGVVPTKPATTVGTPSDGAWIDESSRVLGATSRYDSTPRIWSRRPALESARRPALRPPHRRLRHPQHHQQRHHGQLPHEGVRSQQACRRSLPAQRAAVLPPLAGQLVQHLRRCLLAERRQCEHAPRAGHQLRDGRTTRRRRQALHHAPGRVPLHQAA